ncbi:MAG: nicotinate (nicotinamide) nucleotide adenylyltransferase [Ardenticatenales bacterium]|nr:nicotinate (nicotinamide) nucleotide adenylyltransferase [Ardenticatenales bacterium]
MDRLGILGGSFDPPHRGHLTLAEAAYRQLVLDQVLWVPAGLPPHKPSLTPVHHRLAMTELCIAGRPHFALSRLDTDRPGPHYTADLLAPLLEKHGLETSFWFLVGEDSLRELKHWYHPERLVGALRLAVYPRPGPPVDWGELERIVPGIEDRVDWLVGPPHALASSLIRERFRQGHPVGEDIPAAVHRYIEDHKLYRR